MTDAKLAGLEERFAEIKGVHMRYFVGGTGHEVARLLRAAWDALLPGGNLVANVATLESLSGTYAVLKGLAGSAGVLLVNIARGMEQLETLRFEAANPTFLLHVSKPESRIEDRG